MHVDENGKYQLTNFYGKNHKGKLTESDHAMVKLHVNLQFVVQKPLRTEAINYKNAESRHLFKDLTTVTSEFSNCFSSNETFQNQVKKWEHTLKQHVVQAFSKIRSRKRKFSKTDIGVLLEKRKKLKLDDVNNPKAIDKIENGISDKIAESYYTKVKETMGYIKGDDGAVSHHGVWKAQKTLIPKDTQCNPMAIKYITGQLITNPEGIRKLSLEEILDRVRHRKIHPKLQEMQQFKEILCNKRLNLVKHM